MDLGKDYYLILGVLPSIDATALTAVYRALIKKYHPDVHAGSKSDAERITKELNEAFGVLSNATTRAEYDRKRNGGQNSSGDFDRESDQAGPNQNGPDSDIKKNWDYIVRYYPNAEQFRVELSELSSALAFAYQATVIETKSAADASKLSTNLKRQFLERYFGTNTAVQAFVLEALKAKRREVAVEVNRAIKVLGSPSAKATAQFIETVRRVTGWRGFQRPEAYRPTERTSTSPKGRSNVETAQAENSQADRRAIFALLVIFPLLAGFLFLRGCTN